jgi:hypothetical protein
MSQEKDGAVDTQFEQSVHMYRSFKTNFLKSQQTAYLENKASNRESELPMIKENSTHRQSVRQRQFQRGKVDIKKILRENLNNKTLHHRNIIDAYFKKDRNLVKSKQGQMFRSYN